VEPKFTPSSHGTVKKKSLGELTGNAGGTKRSRPLDAGSGVADSLRSMRSSPSFESGDVRPTKKRKVIRYTSERSSNSKIKLKYLHANKVFYGFNSVN
jgi:hypothetical protein